MADIFMPTEGLPSTGHVLVLTANAHEAAAWAYEAGVDRARLVIAASPESVVGLRPAAVVTLPGWTRHRNAEKIAEAARHVVDKHPCPTIEVHYTQTFTEGGA